MRGRRAADWESAAWTEAGSKDAKHRSLALWGTCMMIHRFCVCCMCARMYVSMEHMRSALFTSRSVGFCLVCIMRLACSYACASFHFHKLVCSVDWVSVNPFRWKTLNSSNRTRASEMHQPNRANVHKSLRWIDVIGMTSARAAGLSNRFSVCVSSAVHKTDVQKRSHPEPANRSGKLHARRMFWCIQRYKLGDILRQRPPYGFHNQTMT